MDDALITGIHIIDKQHKELFDTISRLKEVKHSSDEFWHTLISLQNYVADHFSTEEGFMQSCGYPYYEEHKLAHELFVKGYKELLVKIADAKDVSILNQDLSCLLSDLVKDHYTKEDVRMAKFLKAHMNQF